MASDPIDSALVQLRHYEARVLGIEKSLATMTIRWIESMMERDREEEVLSDPIVGGQIKKAQMMIGCGWKAENRLFAAETGHILRIFCDGACERNGQPGARAGYGVYAANIDGTSVVRHSAPMSASEPQTNQRAELRAMYYAIGYASAAIMRGTRVEIYSDSRYAIDCLTKWAPGWVSSGWVKSDKKPVLHTDLIKSSYELLSRSEGRIVLKHVPAHTGLGDLLSLGNAEADRLAREGASGIRSLFE
jgi:ribonuclease HI